VQKDGQAFAVNAQVPGRWFRMTVKNTHGGGIAQLFNVRGYGDRLSHEPPPNVTGTYETDAGKLTSSRPGRVSPAATSAAPLRSSAGWRGVS